MDHLSGLADYYRRYGEDSFGLDEPAYAAICNTIADRRDLLELLAAQPHEAQQPNLILAAVHYLLLGGLEHPLRAVYYGTSEDDPGALFADLVLANRDDVLVLLDSRRTQTNEVGRCAVLALAMSHARALTDRPLAWIDLGTSGGLNLGIDLMRIDYDLGGRVVSTGPADASLVIECTVRGGLTEVSPRIPDIVWRVGIDRAPVDVTDADDARWLLACLWPSQPDRARRLAAAIEIARFAPPEIIAAEAVAGIRLALDRAPVDATIVVTTTWVWFYLPSSTRDEVLSLMRGAQQRVLWYSLEGEGVVAELGQALNPYSVGSTIGLVELGGGEAERASILGSSHPHGTWIDWAPAQVQPVRSESGDRQVAQ